MGKNTKAQDFGDRDGFIWLDGLIVPWREATIHSLSHGLHYGGSVFEGERSFDGHIFLSNEHSERLLFSAKEIGMEIPYTAQEINEAKDKVLKKNDLKNAYIRAFAWRGSDQLGLSAKDVKTHVAISCWEWPSYYGDGLTLQTSRWRAPNPKTAPTRSKAACNYPTHTMVKDEAVANGYGDGLMLDYRGKFIAEASGANIFMVKDGTIKTPIPHCFLNGLTRQTIIKIAQRDGLNIQECDITPDELITADEVFVTGTAANVTPVTKIDDTEFKVGPITKKMQKAYDSITHSPEEENKLRTQYPYNALKK